MSQSPPLHVPHDPQPPGNGFRPAAGELEVWPGITGPGADARRDLYILVPPSYRSSDRRYPVLYMHDGQNLFDPALSFAGSWRVDRAMAVLAAEGLEAIIVGIPNLGARRLDEYGPFYDRTYRHGGRGAEYIDFVAGTVKPLVDRRLRTRPEPAATGLMGSSMGGLISLYGLAARPDVFSFAGALSPSLFFARDRILGWLRTVPALRARVFVSMGTAEGAGRTAIKRWRRAHTHIARVQRLVRALEKKGLDPNRDIMRVVVHGGQHNETTWSAILPDALRFLLPRP